MPKVLTLIRLEALDLQEEGDDAFWDFDDVGFVVVLDGYPVKTFGRRQYRDLPTVFSEADNISDAGEPFVFWSFADITVYESDSEGLPYIDSDPDEWIQTVHISPDDDSPVEIGSHSGLTHRSPGRSDCRYQLWYRITEQHVGVDEKLLNDLEQASAPSEFVGVGATAGDLAADKGDCRWICSIDGGGLRGIFPLRMLEQLEDYYGASCFEIFDMFAGTSTGAIIAGSLASGMPLEKVVALYADGSMRRKIFRPNSRGQRHAFRYLDLTRLSPAGLTNETLDGASYPAKFSDTLDIATGTIDTFIRTIARQVMTPRYRKIGMKALLHQLLSTAAGDELTPLRLRDCAVGDDTKDILITAWDQQRSETTLFTAFHMLHRQIFLDPPVVDVVTGHYRDVLLKDAVEASASAPVYFSPRGRFTDGGVGPYNNPSFIAAHQALFRSADDTTGASLELEPKYLPYAEGPGGRSGTVVWSFGTAYRDRAAEDGADAASLISGALSLNRRTDTALFWLEDVLDSLMAGASQEQVFLCRELLGDKIKYVRVNLGLSLSTLEELNVPGFWPETLAAIKLDARSEHDFDLMDEVAKRFALRARNERFGFEAGGFELPDPTWTDADLRTYSTWVKTELTDLE